MKRKKIQKIIAILTLISFSWSSVCPAGVELQTVVSSLRSEIALSHPQIRIPRELGSIEKEKYFRGSKKILIHIQDAHGSYEAQKMIQGLVKYLCDKYGISELYLEGSKGRLHPELFHFFKEKELNLKAADLLMRSGEFTGSEMFLLENEGRKAVTGTGIESVAKYRKDWALFREVMGHEEQSENYLKQRERALEEKGNRVYSPELKHFVREWRRWKKEDEGLLRYANFLDKTAVRELLVDLKSGKDQLEYSDLTRLAVLREMEGKVDLERVKKEKALFVEALKGKVPGSLLKEVESIGTEGTIGRSEDGTRRKIRYVMEDLYAEMIEKDGKLPEYEEFKKFVKHRMLEEELEGEELYREIETLTEKVFESLARTEDEKQLVLEEKEALLIRKLLKLELSREEWKEMKGKNLNGMNETAQISGMMEKAREFYGLAEAREESFLKKVTAKKGILVTGGFHAEGLEAGFEKEGISYVSVKPRLSEAGRSREIYLKAMLGKTELEENGLKTSEIGKVLALTPLALQKRMGVGLERSALVREAVDHVRSVFDGTLIQGNPYFQAQAASMGSEKKPAEERKRYIKRKKEVWAEWISKLRSKNPNIRKEGVEALASEYIGRTAIMMNATYNRTRYFVEEIAGLPFIKVEWDDFYSEGVAAIYDILSSYHKIPEDKLPKYFYNYVYGQVERILRDYMNSYLNIGASNLDKVLGALGDVVQNPGTDLADSFKLSKRDVLPLLRKRMPRLDEIVELISKKEQASFEDVSRINKYEETVVWEEGAFLEQVTEGELLSVLMEVIKKLTYREREILKLKFGIPDGYEYNLEEIGKVFKITKERVRQINAKAIRKLQQPWSSQQLVKFFLESLEREDFPNLSSTIFPAGEVQPERTIKRIPKRVSKRTEPLSEQEEDELLAVMDDLPGPQRKILPYVLKGKKTEEIARILSVKKSAELDDAYRRLLGTLRGWYTFDMLNRFGHSSFVRREMIRLGSESKVSRLLRRKGMDALIEVSQGDKDAMADLLMQLYPGQFSEKQIHRAVQERFNDIAANIKRTPGHKLTPKNILMPTRRLIQDLEAGQFERRKRILIRLLRDFYYPFMRKDEETRTTEGLDALKAEWERSSKDTNWQQLVKTAYDYYRQARPFQPRGLNLYPNGADQPAEPLIPAQRYGIWQALQTLQDPKEKSAFLASEARVGKTTMALLAALNIKNDKGEYAVKRMLYTTTNQAKYEAAREFKRIHPDLNLNVIVIDSDKGPREDQIRQAMAAEGNVVLIANYEAVRDFPELFGEYKPDVHIVDEIDNLRHGSETDRAPAIFGVPAEYRIAISARPVVNDPDDIIEALLWTRNQTFKDRSELLQQTPDELYGKLDPVLVRWRRKIVLPELGEPQEITEHLPLSSLQTRVTGKIRDDFVQWKRTEARRDKNTDADHLFRRVDMERRVSVDPALVLPDAQFVLHPPQGNPILIEADQEQIKIGKTLFNRKINENKEWVQFTSEEDAAVKFKISLVNTPAEVEILGKVYRVERQRLTDFSPKVQRLDQIIEAERKKNGKVIILVDFVEEVGRLVERYNQKYGAGTAVGTTGEIDSSVRDVSLQSFRRDDQPSLLIGTPFLLGASLNLTPYPGSSFHSSTLVRMNQSWIYRDDADRLIAIGRDTTYPVKVINLISTFPSSANKKEETPLTVDQKIEKRLAGHKDIFTRVVDGKPILDDASVMRLNELEQDMAQEAPKASSLGADEEIPLGENNFDLNQFDLPDWAKGFELLNKQEARILYAMAMNDPRIYFGNPQKRSLSQKDIDRFFAALFTPDQTEKDLRRHFDDYRRTFFERWIDLEEMDREMLSSEFFGWLRAFFTLENKFNYGLGREPLLALDRLTPSKDGHRYLYRIPTKQLYRIYAGASFYSDRGTVIKLVDNEIVLYSRDNDQEEFFLTGEALEDGGTFAVVDSSKWSMALAMTSFGAYMYKKFHPLALISRQQEKISIEDNASQEGITVSRIVKPRKQTGDAGIASSMGQQIHVSITDHGNFEMPTLPDGGHPADLETNTITYYGEAARTFLDRTTVFPHETQILLPSDTEAKVTVDGESYTLYEPGAILMHGGSQAKVEVKGDVLVLTTEKAPSWFERYGVQNPFGTMFGEKGYNTTGVVWQRGNVTVHAQSQKRELWDKSRQTEWLSDSMSYAGDKGPLVAGVSRVVYDKPGIIPFTAMRPQEKLHRHPMRDGNKQIAEIYMVTKGKGVLLYFSKDGKPLLLTLKPGDAAFVYAGAVHELVAAEGPYEHLVTQIPSNFQYGFWFKEDVDPSAMRVDLPGMVQAGIEKLEEESEEQKPVKLRRLPRSSNPYALEENVNRDFQQLDELHGGRISASMDRRVKAGQKTKVLMIGIGRGNSAYELLRKYEGAIDLYSLAKENLLHTPGTLQQSYWQKLGMDDAKKYIARIESKYDITDVEKSFGEFDKESFDVIIVAQSVMEYIKDRTGLVERMKSRLVVGGELFTDLDIFNVVSAKTGKDMNIQQVFESLNRGTEESQKEFRVYPAFKNEREWTFEIYPVLHVVNLDPSNNKIPLRPLTSSSIIQYAYQPPAASLGAASEDEMFKILETALGHTFRRRKELSLLFQTEKFSGFKDVFHFIGYQAFKFAAMDHVMRKYPDIERHSLGRYNDIVRSKEMREHLFDAYPEAYQAYQKFTRQYSQETYSPDDLALILLGALMIDNDIPAMRNFLAPYFDLVEKDMDAFREWPGFWGKKEGAHLEEFNKMARLLGQFPDSQKTLSRILGPNNPTLRHPNLFLIDQRFATWGDAILDLVVVGKLWRQWGWSWTCNEYQKAHDVLTSNRTIGKVMNEALQRVKAKTASDPDRKNYKATLFEAMVAVVFSKDRDLNGEGFERATAFVDSLFESHLKIAKHTEANGEQGRKVRQAYRSMESFIEEEEGGNGKASSLGAENGKLLQVEEKAAVPEAPPVPIWRRVFNTFLKYSLYGFVMNVVLTVFNVLFVLFPFGDYVPLLRNTTPEITFFFGYVILALTVGMISLTGWTLKQLRRPKLQWPLKAGMFVTFFSLAYVLLVRPASPEGLFFSALSFFTLTTSIIFIISLLVKKFFPERLGFKSFWWPALWLALFTAIHQVDLKLRYIPWVLTGAGTQTVTLDSGHQIRVHGVQEGSKDLEEIRKALSALPVNAQDFSDYFYYPHGPERWFQGGYYPPFLERIVMQHGANAKETMWHEAGHHAHWKHVRGEDADQWTKSFGEYRRNHKQGKTAFRVSEYSMTNRFEGFAEWFAHFMSFDRKEFLKVLESSGKAEQKMWLIIGQQFVEDREGKPFLKVRSPKTGDSYYIELTLPKLTPDDWNNDTELRDRFDELKRAIGEAANKDSSASLGQEKEKWMTAVWKPGVRPLPENGKQSIALYSEWELIRIVPTWPIPMRVEVEKNQPGRLHFVLTDRLGDLFSMELSVDEKDPRTVLLKGLAPVYAEDASSLQPLIDPVLLNWVRDHLSPWLLERKFSVLTILNAGEQKASLEKLGFQERQEAGRQLMEKKIATSSSLGEEGISALPPEDLKSQPGSAGSSMGMMSMSLHLAPVMQLTQKLEQRQLAVMKQLMILEEEYAALERAVAAVRFSALHRPNGIVHYQAFGLDFKYVLATKKDYDAATYPDINESDSEVFQRRLREAGGGMLHYSERAGRYVLIVDGDRIPAEFVPFVAVHEYAESVLGSHLEATKVEFEIVQRKKVLRKYINWVSKDHPDKFANVATLVEHMDLLFVPESVREGTRYQDYVSRRIRSEESRKVSELITEFSWPVFLLRAIVKAEENNKKAEQILRSSLALIQEKAGRAPSAWSELLKDLEEEGKKTLALLRQAVDAERLNPALIRNTWEEGRRQASLALLETWQRYKAAKGEETVMGEMQMGMIPSSDLEHFSLFRSQVDIMDLLREEPKTLPEGSSLGEQREDLVRTAAALNILNEASFTQELNRIQTGEDLRRLTNRIPRKNLPDNIQQVFREILTAGFKDRVLEHLRAQLRQNNVNSVVARDEALTRYFNEDAGLDHLAWVTRNGKFFILSKFYDHLAALKIKDPEQGEKIFSGVLMRLAVIDLLWAEFRQRNIRITPVIKKAILKFARLYEKHFAGPSRISGPDVFTEPLTAVTDAANTFIYHNRFDRRTTLADQEVYKRSSPSVAERTVETFRSKLTEVMQGYYDNRNFFQRAGRESARVASMRQKFTALFEQLRQQYLGANNVHGLSARVIQGINGITDPQVLEDKIKRYTKNYETLLERMSSLIEVPDKRARLERLNENALELLSRLIVMETHPLRINALIQNAALQPATPQYNILFSRFRLLRYHLSSLKRELLWKRVRETGIQEITRYIYGDNEELINTYLLDQDFFVREGDDIKYPAFLTGAMGEIRPGSWRGIKDTIQKLMERGAIKYQRIQYRSRELYLPETVERILKPFWEDAATPLSNVQDFRKFIVERIREEGVKIGKPWGQVTLQDAVALLVSDPIAKEELTGIILQDIENYLLQASLTDENKRTEIEPHFDLNLRPDIVRVAPEIGEARYKHLLDLLRSYNHTLSSYAEANLTAHEMIGYLDDALNRLKTLRGREFRNLDNVEEAERRARQFIRKDLARVLKWSLDGEKLSRTIAQEDITAAQLAMQFEDDRMLEKSVRWARVHIENYIEENIRIAKYTSLKAMKLRDEIRRPVQRLLSGATIYDTKQEIERMRGRYFPPRFTDPGYQRARKRLREVMNVLDTLDGRTILFGGDNRQNNRAREKYVKVLIELELLLYDVIYKHTSNEDFEVLEPGLREQIERKLLQGQAIDDVVTFDRQTLQRIHERVDDGQSLGGEAPLEVLDYARKTGRPVNAILEVATRYAGSILYLPEADPVVQDWFYGKMGLEERPEAVDPRALAFNMSLDPFWGYMKSVMPEISQVESPEGKVPMFLDASVVDSPRNKLQAGNLAQKIAQSLNAGDLLAVIWQGDQKPDFVSDLFKISRGRFEVRDLRRELATDSEVTRLTKGYDIPPIGISAVEEDGFELSFRGGDRVKLDLKVLARYGMDPAQVIALLRQIADYPELRDQLFQRAGLEKSGDFWLVGSRFVQVLLDTIYAEKAAQQSLQAAA